eukprot:402082-Rhodomonas_salina.4
MLLGANCEQRVSAESHRSERHVRSIRCKPYFTITGRSTKRAKTCEHMKAGKLTWDDASQSTGSQKAAAGAKEQASVHVSTVEVSAAGHRVHATWIRRRHIPVISLQEGVVTDYRRTRCVFPGSCNRTVRKTNELKCRVTNPGRVVCKHVTLNATSPQWRVVVDRICEVEICEDQFRIGSKPPGDSRRVASYRTALGVRREPAIIIAPCSIETCGRIQVVAVDAVPRVAVDIKCVVVEGLE